MGSAKKPAAHTAQPSENKDFLAEIAPKEKEADGGTMQTRGPLVREAAGKWRTELAEATRKDAETGPVPRVSLGSPHPGGLAQLYAERPTRLSSLVRESNSYRRAVDSLQGVVEKAEALATRYGSSAIHLVIGTASWGGKKPAKSVPVLLRQVTVERTEDGDFMLRVKSGVEVSNRLLDAFARLGEPIEAQALISQMTTKHGFSPAPALRVFKEVGQKLPDFELHETLSLGIYVHPASGLLRELGAPQSLSLSAVVRALANDPAALDELSFEIPPANPHDRAPWEERGLGDQSPQTQDAVEVATGKHSVCVDVPPSADLAATACSIAAEHAVRGKHVLLVSSSAPMRSQLTQTLERLQVPEIAALLESTDEAEDAVLEQLQYAMSDLSEVIDQDELDTARMKLWRIRETLSNHTEALHAKFSAWGISAYDALQVLSELTSIHDSPGTKVRVDEETLARLSLDSGDEARGLLERASELGMFSQAHNASAWRGVRLMNANQVEEALAALERLNSKELQVVHAQMLETAKQTGLPAANTIAKWAQMLETLEGVRDSLDVFRPEVFEHSMADMIVATASKQWRKDRGIKLKGSRRRALVRQAQELALPGSNLERIHSELVLAQARREEWLKICEENTWPRLPRRFEDMLKCAMQVESDLQIVGHYVSSLYGDLRTLPINELAAVLAQLAAQSELARMLPQRYEVESALTQMGLAEFLEDLMERQVAHNQLTLELDLCWWASALTLMIVNNPDLGGYDPAMLQEMLEEARELDQQQVDTLGLQIIQRIRRLRASALSLHPDQHETLTQTIQNMRDTQNGTAAQLFANFSLAWDLLPVVVTGQSLVPTLVPWGRSVDVVILCGVDSASLAELVPVVARAKQVVVVADLEHAAPQSPLGQLGAILPHVRVQDARAQVNDQINLLLSKYLEVSPGASVPGRKTRGLVEAVWAEGTGMPAPGAHGIESSEGEAKRVVQVVTTIAHNRRAALQVDPNVRMPSLAVIALTARQAERISTLLGIRSQADPVLAEFLEENSLEPFCVVGPEQGAALKRDQVILSFGFAKTPHGRVIHDFGLFSKPNGLQLLAQILSAARNDMTVVSTLRPSDIDKSRLRRDSERLLWDLLKLAAGELDLSQVDLDPESERDAGVNLLQDLAVRLQKMGLPVVSNLGAPGGMRIPLAIGHPEVPNELLVAVLTDDVNYLAEPSLRVRDRYWPEMLESQGWKVLTELSMAVFSNPNREVDRIVQLTLDAVDDYYVAHNRPETLAAAMALGYSTVMEPSHQQDAATGMVAFYGEDSQGAAVTGMTPQVAPGMNPATGMMRAVGRVAGADGNTNTGVISATNAGSSASTTDDEFAAAQSRERKPRPAIAAGLPLSAYSDDQLDEVAMWIRSDGLPRTDDQMVEEIRSFLRLTRRGIQSDAVLNNVVARTRPESELEVE